MAQEVIELEIKANVQPATKQVDEFTKALTGAEYELDEINKSLKESNKFLADQKIELINLKAKQDAIPKGAWYAGMDNLNKKIKETEKNIKEEAVVIGQLKEEQKSASKEVSKFNKELKETNKEATDSIGNFKVMGVSLNGVKSAFGKIIPIAKAMFGTIKAGILSTGIGALLIAFGSLVTYFTSTKKGADQLKVVFAALGATVNVLKDRISGVGEAISLVFSGKWKEAGEALKGTFAGIGAEIKADVAAMTALEKRTQALRDAEIEFTVQRAETRKEIEKARLLAEDETKSQEVRIEALKKALKLEQETTDTELKLAKERVAIQEEQMDTAENLVEAEKKLADFKADVINKETKSFRLQKRVKTEINELERELHTERMQRLKELQDANKERTDGMVALTNMFEQQMNKQIDGYEKLYQAADYSYGKQKTIELQLRELSENRIEWAAMTENERVNLAKNTLNDLGKIAGEETELGKALAITQTTIATYQSAQESYKSLSGIPVIGPALGGVAAAAAIAMGLRNIQAIRSAGKNGVQNTGGLPSPNISSQTPAPEMLSGKFELGNIQEQQPVQAYVVTDSLTDNQNKLAYIRRRATI